MSTATKFVPPHWTRRAPVLGSLRRFRMARSAHAYVRGSALKFYEWLDSQAGRALPVGPEIWICGDCHLGNLGPVADLEGNVAIQIRDFDQTVIGNPVHDLIRLALSLSMAASRSDLPGVTIAHMIEDMVEGYVAGLSSGGVRPAVDKPHIVADALRQAHARCWKHLAREQVAGKTARLTHGKRFWPISKKERSAMEALFASDALRPLALRLSHRTEQPSIRLADVAYWMKGCSSLGLLRYAILLEIAGEATGRDLCLVDVKEAVKALAPRAAKARMPTDNGERVLEGARLMSPNLGERMVSAHLGERSVFVRELLPEDLKLELDHVLASEATKAARYLAAVVGYAHARQMKRSDQARWSSEIARNHTKSLDAPSWLWSSVVELIGTHERSYLEHCRRYALNESQA